MSAARPQVDERPSRRRGALRTAGAFVAWGPPVGLALTLVESVARDPPPFDPQVLNPFVWFLGLWGAYVIGGPPAFVSGAAVGAVVRSPQGRRRLAVPIAVATGAAATLGWLRLITGGITTDHVVTAVVAGVSGAVCCWLVPPMRGLPSRRGSS